MAIVAVVFAAVTQAEKHPDYRPLSPQALLVDVAASAARGRQSEQLRQWSRQAEQLRQWSQTDATAAAIHGDPPLA
jgi:hypothetical protein